MHEEERGNSPRSSLEAEASSARVSKESWHSNAFTKGREYINGRLMLWSATRP